LDSNLGHVSSQMIEVGSTKKNFIHPNTAIDIERTISINPISRLIALALKQCFHDGMTSLSVEDQRQDCDQDCRIH
jgi:hypothetical protein